MNSFINVTDRCNTNSMITSMTIHISRVQKASPSNTNRATVGLSVTEHCVTASGLSISTGMQTTEQQATSHPRAPSSERPRQAGRGSAPLREATNTQHHNLYTLFCLIDTGLDMTNPNDIFVWQLSTPVSIIK